MIIRLKNADFSENNIGSLSTWTIAKSLGHGATYNGVNYVDRNAPLNATITIAEGYELGAAGVTVSMGGKVVTSGVTVNGNTITISIDVVTGNVKITVPTININTGEEDGGNTGGGNTGEEEITNIKLFQGFVSGHEINTELATRVRTDAIYGPFTIKTNNGYVIRAIYSYPTAEVEDKTVQVEEVVTGAALTEYTYMVENRYCYITFCKTDTNANILPTEDIIKEFLIPEANPLIAQLDLKVGQYLSTSWNPDNMARAVVGVPLNDYTSISTAGSNYVMIPLIDDDDTTSNGVFHTLGMSGSSYSKDSTSYQYKDTINIADVQAVNTDNKPIYVMFKKSDNANINVHDLANYITIN